MYDAHIRSWKRHLERDEMRRLLAARRGVTKQWEGEWALIFDRVQGMKERPWRT